MWVRIKGQAGMGDTTVVAVKVEGSLSCSDHDVVEFRISCGWNRIPSRITTLHFSKANFGVFKQLLGEIPWEQGT